MALPHPSGTASTQTALIKGLSRMSAVRLGLFLGVPAYEDTGVGYHHPHVENLSNALAGVNAGLEQLGDERAGFVGIAVYADWTTTEDEWQQFRRQFGNE